MIYLKKVFKGQIEQTDYMTSILKGILELPSDKNKWAPSKIQKWRILDIHKRLSIDLEKLLEEEKKRVVEKIKLQFGEGQEWVKAVEISAEDMDNILKIDQLKDKEEDKIKSIISPIIDELLKETTTNSDYLNEIIDEARTQEIQKEAYFTDWIHVDSDSDSDIPSWGVNIDSDSDSEDDKLGVEESKRIMPPIMISASSEEDMLPNLAEALDAMRDQSARFGARRHR